MILPLRVFGSSGVKTMFADPTVVDEISKRASDEQAQEAEA